MAEKIKWIEVVLVPIVLAIIGGVSTLLITSMQKKHTTEMGIVREENAKFLAKSETNMKYLEIYSNLMTKGTVKAEELAIITLELLAYHDSDLASKLAKIVDKDELKETSTQIIPENVTKNIQRCLLRLSRARRNRPIKVRHDLSIMLIATTTSKTPQSAYIEIIGNTPNEGLHTIYAGSSYPLIYNKIVYEMRVSNIQEPTSAFRIGLSGETCF